MRPTAIRMRYPMIKFLGKRSLLPAQTVDHTPKVHPQSPHNELPSSFSSFAAYRKNAQTHGPLGSNAPNKSSIKPKEGEFFARRDLPKRLHYSSLTEDEMDNVNSGGAEVVY